MTSLISRHPSATAKILLYWSARIPEGKEVQYDRQIHEGALDPDIGDVRPIVPYVRVAALRERAILATIQVIA